jgi:hypothetical protein
MAGRGGVGVSLRPPVGSSGDNYQKSASYSPHDQGSGAPSPPLAASPVHEVTRPLLTPCAARRSTRLGASGRGSPSPPRPGHKARHNRLCWLTQNRAEKRACRRRLGATEAEFIPVVKSTPRSWRHSDRSHSGSRRLSRRGSAASSSEVHPKNVQRALEPLRDNFQCRSPDKLIVRCSSPQTRSRGLANKVDCEPTIGANMRGREPTFGAYRARRALTVRKKSGSPSIRTHGVRFIGGDPDINDRGKGSFSPNTRGS